MPGDVKGEMHYLWPTPVLTRILDDHGAVNPALLALFYRHRDRDDAAPGAVYASRDNLLEVYVNDPAVARLSAFIAESVFEIARVVNAGHWRNADDIQVDVSGLWFQISNNFGFHETHIHGNCSWSGVYYVQSGDAGHVPAASAGGGMPNGITRFYGPHMDISAGGHGDLGNLYLQDAAWDSVPEDGRLVVFPAHLKHMAFPYHGATDRVIVSFHAQVNSKRGYRLRYKFA